MVSFPLLYRGIICIALALRYRVLFYALKTKLRLKKSEKESFDVLGMKLYYLEN